MLAMLSATAETIRSAAFIPLTNAVYTRAESERAVEYPSSPGAAQRTCHPAPPMKSSGNGRAFARVALAGNPSDGYGGRTLAVVLRDFAASASATPCADADRLTSPGPGGEQLMRAAL